MRFSTGDDQVVIHGMKHSSQHGIIGALQRRKREQARFSADCGANTDLDNGSSGYLDLSQLLLLLPVPNGQDVIVGVVHSTQERAAILTGREPVQYDYL